MFIQQSYHFRLICFLFQKQILSASISVPFRAIKRAALLSFSAFFAIFFLKKTWYRHSQKETLFFGVRLIFGRIFFERKCISVPPSTTCTGAQTYNADLSDNGFLELLGDGLYIDRVNIGKWKVHRFQTTEIFRSRKRRNSVQRPVVRRRRDLPQRRRQAATRLQTRIRQQSRKTVHSCWVHL